MVSGFASNRASRTYLIMCWSDHMIRPRILFVDDDVLNQWLVTDSLSEMGFTVTGLCRGMQAVAMLEHGREFDLLLTDFNVPGEISGFELAEHWRRMQPGRPILYTSLYPQVATATLQRDEAYIRKHADVPDLLGVINQLLEDAYEWVTPGPRRRAPYFH
jgi:CheY-like chemotaxis protein